MVFHYGSPRWLTVSITSFRAVLLEPGSDQGSPLHCLCLYVSFSTQALQIQSLCDEIRPAILWEIPILYLSEHVVYFVALSLFRPPWLFSQTTAAVLFQFPALQSSPTTYPTFSIFSSVKFIFLYQVIYLLKAFIMAFKALPNLSPPPTQLRTQGAWGQRTRWNHLGGVPFHCLLRQPVRWSCLLFVFTAWFWAPYLVPQGTFFTSSVWSVVWK